MDSSTRLDFERVPLKNPYQIGRLDHLAKYLYLLFAHLRPQVVPGGTGADLASSVAAWCREQGLDTPLLGYQGFPAPCCVNHGEVVAHGIPRNRAFAAGDLVTVDMVLSHDGWHADASWTYGVGSLDVGTDTHRKRAWRASLAGVGGAGKGLGAMVAAVRREAKGPGTWLGLSFAGHGIGRDVHEAPRMAYHQAVQDDRNLPPGLVWTMEPVVLAGPLHGSEPRRNQDGEWILEGGCSAQFELMCAMDGRDAVVLGMPKAWQGLACPPF